jgi:uncharacterized protein YbjT (DUF2867 family)
MLINALAAHPAEACYLREMRLLLIGGSGFIGPHVARILLAQGHETGSDLRSQGQTYRKEALAATSPQASGRIYNIAERRSFSEIEWAQHIGRSAGWKRVGVGRCSGFNARAFESALQFGSALDHEQRKNSRRVGIYRSGFDGCSNGEDHRVGARPSAGAS